MYVFGCKLSHVRLCDSDFGITPVGDITIGITCAAFCFHIAHISFSSSWYLFCLSVIVLARLCVFGTAMSIKNVFFVFLFIKVMSGRLKGIVLSASVIIIIIIIIIIISNYILFLIIRILTRKNYISGEEQTFHLVRVRKYFFSNFLVAVLNEARNNCCCFRCNLFSLSCLFPPSVSLRYTESTLHKTHFC